MALFSAATAARSTFLFTCRYQWDLLTEEPGMNRFTCNLPLANCCLLHLQGLSPAQTRMLMKNLPALSKLTFNQQNQVLPLLLGHPHTIRLFDAYLKQYGLDAVLQDETIIGRGGRPSAPTAIIEKLGEYFLDGLWSRLNAAEKDVLGLLSVFRMNLTEKGLKHLVKDSKVLQTLLNFSLLQRESHGDKSGVSYQVHPVVRGYVENKLGTEKIRSYHLQAVEFYVEDQTAPWPQAQGIEKWTPELLSNLVNSMALQGEAELAQLLTNHILEMHHHLFAASEYERAAEIVTDVFRFLATIGRRDLAKSLLHQSIVSLEGFRKYNAKGNLCTLLVEEGKWKNAIDIYQECIDYFLTCGEIGKPNLAAYIAQQAQVYQNLDEYEKALELLQKASTIFEEIKDEKNLVTVDCRILQLLIDMNRYSDAVIFGEQVLQKTRLINNAHLEAGCLLELGKAFTILNKPQQAFDRFQDSLIIAEKSNDREAKAATLAEMGKLFLAVGKCGEAVQFLQMAITIFNELNYPINVATTLAVIGFIFEEQGHLQEALEKYQEALRLKQQYDSTQQVASIESDIARVKEKMKSQ